MKPSSLIERICFQKMTLWKHALFHLTSTPSSFRGLLLPRTRQAMWYSCDFGFLNARKSWDSSLLALFFPNEDPKKGLSESACETRKKKSNGINNQPQLVSNSRPWRSWSCKRLSDSPLFPYELSVTTCPISRGPTPSA